MLVTVVKVINSALPTENPQALCFFSMGRCSKNAAACYLQGASNCAQTVEYTANVYYIGKTGALWNGILVQHCDG